MLWADTQLWINGQLDPECSGASKASSVVLGKPYMELLWLVPDTHALLHN